MSIPISVRGGPGENEFVHVCWIHKPETRNIIDFGASEGDTLVFEGHLVCINNVSHKDYDGDGKNDAILTFRRVSMDFMNANGGDWVGEVVVLHGLIAWKAFASTSAFFCNAEERYSIPG